MGSSPIIRIQIGSKGHGKGLKVDLIEADLFLYPTATCDMRVMNFRQVVIDIYVKSKNGNCY